MVVIGRVGPPRVSHFDGALGKWGMTPKCLGGDTHHVGAIAGASTSMTWRLRARPGPPGRGRPPLQ